VRIYVAGPMSGRVDGNAARFGAACQWLRDCGHEAINPHDIDAQAGVAADWSQPIPVSARQQAMRRDIPVLATCDAVLLIHDWWNSQGAFDEFCNARAFGLKIFFDAHPEHLQELQHGS